MKTLKPTSVFFNFFLLLVVLTSTSCEFSGERSQKRLKKTHLTLMSASSNPFFNNEVVEVVSEGMDFQIANEIPYGWTTFRYKNLSKDTHFFVLEKMPAGKNIENSKKEVIPVFQRGMDLINEGKIEEGYAAFNNLPAWFFKVKIEGGSGLISPGNASETTINLEPGYYVMECYVKMPNGKFHSYYGMLKGLKVSSEKNEQKSPAASVHIAVSSEKGIVFNSSDLKRGKQIIEVEYIDQKPHEHFMGHDIHLVKLDENASFATLNSWMNWANPEGFISPSPPGFTFLGGCQEMDAGKKGYFKVDLKPGNYAFVSEVPNPQEKRMLQTFTVL